MTLPFSLFPLASAAGSEAGSVTETMMHFILQLAVILMAARMGGSVARRWLKMPQVLGELMAGILISPYALGGLALGSIPPLFVLPAGGMLPVSSELYALATLASVLLLFLAGLETDLQTFFRYSGAATVVGIGGIVFAFVLGDLCALWFGVAERFMDPSALFLGTISTATSVGITARILSDRRKTHTPEGASIMAAAVLDDVLGIIILAVVIGISQVGGDAGHGVNWGKIGLTAGKAFGFWLLCTAGALLVAPYISRTLKISRNPATITAMAFGLTLLLAGLSEMAGLAMIIGAYIMGLALSKTDLADFLQDQLRQVYDLLVPVFFCVMGMLVDLGAMKEVLLFGLVYTVLAVLAKVLGCAIPAWMTRFNLRGSLRIGFGMLPRGEVALIVAGIGISSGIIKPELFGVSIMMTVVTTMMAPPLLIKALAGGSGVKASKAMAASTLDAEPIELDLPSKDVADFLLQRLVQAFRNEEFFLHRVHTELPTYQIRKDALVITMVQEESTIRLFAQQRAIHIATMITAEELLSIQDLFESSQQFRDIEAVEARLMQTLFTPDPPAEAG